MTQIGFKHFAKEKLLWGKSAKQKAVVFAYYYFYLWYAKKKCNEPRGDQVHVGLFSVRLVKIINKSNGTTPKKT